MYQFSECRYYTDSCVTILGKDNTIVRDCARAISHSEITEDEDVHEYCKKNPWFCTICDEDNCNNNTGSGYCYECNSVEDPNCWRTLTDDMLTACPFSAQKPGCYHYLRAVGELLKG